MAVATQIPDRRDLQQAGLRLERARSELRGAAEASRRFHNHLAPLGAGANPLPQQQIPA
jgi:hypothetical protein